MHRRSSGFTLIELIAVIVILGVLASSALPKFLDLRTHARLAVIAAMAGELQSVANTVRAACIVRDPNCLSTNSQFFSLWGRTIWINYGYPDAGDNVGNNQIDTLVNTAGWTVSLVSGKTRFALTSATDPANCSITYSDAYFGGGQITITIVTSGC